ncbi:hypothetical protein X946_1572 [Burkholderia sp. ABCPW 111]|nr:hypothetical protein X946_1572 [Burkholderia sp. ABCPW 111]
MTLAPTRPNATRHARPTARGAQLRFHDSGSHVRKSTEPIGRKSICPYVTHARTMLFRGDHADEGTCISVVCRKASQLLEQRHAKDLVRFTAISQNMFFSSAKPVTLKSPDVTSSLTA